MLVLGFILIPFGLTVVIWAFLLPLYLRAASNRWERVPCRIVEHRARYSRTPGWHEAMVYEYVIDGQTYRGDRVRFGQAPDVAHPKNAPPLTPAPGEMAQCWADPKNPMRSVFRRTLDPWVVVAGIAGGTMLLVAARILRR